MVPRCCGGPQQMPSEVPGVGLAQPATGLAAGAAGGGLRPAGG